MYCNQCGHKLSEREKFCTVCGAAVKKKAEKERNNPSKKNMETVNAVQAGDINKSETQSVIKSSEIQKKKLPRKTVIIAAILALVGVAGVYLIITSLSRKDSSTMVMGLVPTAAESPSQEPEEKTLPYEPTIRMELVDGIVLEIRDLYNGIQAGLESYSTVDNGKYKAYLDFGEIVLISEFSDGVTNYYYRDGELYFIVITEADTQSITRLYFSNDELVRFIDKDGAIYDLANTNEDFIDMCDYIDRAYTVYDGIFAFVKENRPGLIDETAGNAATDEEICEAIIASSQMKLLGKTYDQLVSKFGSSTGAVLGIESPASFSFSNTSYTFNFDGGSNDYIVAGRSMDGNGAFADYTYSSEEVDTYFDHEAKCSEVQNVRLGDIISVPNDGFLPDESIFGQYINEMESCYWIQYKGYTFSVSADYDKRVYPNSTVCLYGNR